MKKETNDDQRSHKYYAQMFHKLVKKSIQTLCMAVPIISFQEKGPNPSCVVDKLQQMGSDTTKGHSCYWRFGKRLLETKVGKWMNDQMKISGM